MPTSVTGCLRHHGICGKIPFREQREDLRISDLSDSHGRDPVPVTEPKPPAHFMMCSFLCFHLRISDQPEARAPVRGRFGASQKQGHRDSRSLEQYELQRTASPGTFKRSFK